MPHLAHAVGIRVAAEMIVHPQCRQSRTSTRRPAAGKAIHGRRHRCRGPAARAPAGQPYPPGPPGRSGPLTPYGEANPRRRRHPTDSMRSMPRSLWLSTEHHTSYEPFWRVTVSTADCPGGTVADACWPTPGPWMLRLCAKEPSLWTVKLWVPAVSVAGVRLIENSFSTTLTGVPLAAAEMVEAEVGL